MDGTEAGEFGPGHPGDQAEDPPLFAVGQLRLETHQIMMGPLPVLLAELDDRIRVATRPRIGKADGFHRPETQRVLAARTHHLNGQTAFEVFHVLEVLQRHILRIP
jgi:hypothetical protein